MIQNEWEPNPAILVILGIYSSFYLITMVTPIIADAFKSWKLDQQKNILNAKELLTAYLKGKPGVEAITILDNELYVFVAIKNSTHEETLKFIPAKINDFKVIVVQERFEK